jgi:PAS domain S-box-containing protein
MSLGGKLTLWVLLPILMLLIVYAAITLHREQQIHQGEVRESVERLANTLAISVTDALWRKRPAEISNIVDRSALDKKHFGLVVYDQEGHPILAWGLDAWARGVSRQELMALTSLPRGVGSVEQTSGIPLGSHLIALTADGELLGGLKVSESLEVVQAVLAHERNYFLSMLAVVSIVLVALISITIRRTVTVPLAGLMDRAAVLGRGQIPEDVIVSGRDEVARLAQEFNALARNLEEARQHLVRESKYAQNVVQSITDGIIGLDAAGHIRTWNRAMADRYGIPEAEVLGRDLFEAFPALDREGLKKELNSLFRGERRDFTLRHFEHETIRRGRVVLNIRGSALQDQTSEIAGAVLAIEDVSDRVALAQEVQQAEKLAVIGQLAAGIAHQIGTPLNVISGSAEYLMMEWGSEGQRPHELEIIVAQTDRITKLIQQLLNFARPARMELEPLKPNELLREVLGLTEHPIVRGQITVQTDFQEDLPLIMGDANQLEQALLNIVINAWHAMPDGGTLTLRTRATHTPDRARRSGRPASVGVEASIEDTGTGISPENLPRIFDPFFSTKGVGKGTGLGLAISRRIVMDHHGSIEVASELGKGTRFTIWLPGGSGAA